MIIKEKSHIQKNGFTLIELLIVIAIIGILASIVLVSLASARVKAQEAKYIAYVSSVSRLVEGATAAGEFEGVTYLRGCLGLSKNNHCWGGNSYWETTAYRSLIDGVLGNGMSTAKVAMSPANEEYGLMVYYWPPHSDPFYNKSVVLYAFVGSGNLDMCDKFGWREIRRHGSYCTGSFRTY